MTSEIQKLIDQATAKAVLDYEDDALQTYVLIIYDNGDTDRMPIDTGSSLLHADHAFAEGDELAAFAGSSTFIVFMHVREPEGEAIIMRSVKGDEQGTSAFLVHRETGFAEDDLSMALTYNGKELDTPTQWTGAIGEIQFDMVQRPN